MQSVSSTIRMNRAAESPNTLEHFQPLSYVEQLMKRAALTAKASRVTFITVCVASHTELP
jgi:hypothetical protein